MILAPAIALVLLTILGLTLPHPVPGQFGIGYGAALSEFVAIEGVQAVFYAWACCLVRRGKTSLWLILGTAGLLRVLVVAWPPFLSNDLYRYIWDGWVELAGINPYRYLPVDQHIAFLRDTAVYPNINRATYAHTIYPPAAEMFFAASAGLVRLAHLPPVLGLKLSMLAVEALGIWAMVKLLTAARLPRAWVLIYAWNPVPVWEFAGSGHVDALVVGMFALALLWAGTGQRRLAMAALAGAVLAKFLPVIFFPALWRRWDVWAAGLFVAVILLAYVPYLGVGLGVFGFLSGYTQQEHLSSGTGVYWLNVIGLLIPLSKIVTVTYFAVLAMILGLLAARMMFAPAPSVTLMCQRCLLLGGIAMAGLSPHFSWYYPFLLVPAVIAPSAAAIYLVTSSGLLYLDPSHTGLFWQSFVFIPAIVIAGFARPPSDTPERKPFFFEPRRRPDADCAAKIAPSSGRENQKTSVKLARGGETSAV
jgi:hypothetical protein